MNVQPGRQIQLGIEPADIQKIELSISDPRLDDYLSNIGPALLCLCPTDEIATGIGFEIPGRNAYAVKVGVYMTQSQWPGACEYSLLVAPDTEQTPVLPPEYVQMLEPKPLVQFEVVAGL
jgi:hypothetical protein